MCERGNLLINYSIYLLNINQKFLFKKEFLLIFIIVIRIFLDQFFLLEFIAPPGEIVNTLPALNFFPFVNYTSRGELVALQK